MDKQAKVTLAKYHAMKKVENWKIRNSKTKRRLSKLSKGFQMVPSFECEWIEWIEISKNVSLSKTIKIPNTTPDDHLENQKRK